MGRTMIVCGVLLLVLTGCGSTAAASPSGTPTAGARTTACQTLAKIDQYLTTLSKVGENTTIGEVKAIQKKIETALIGLDKVIPSDMGPRLSDLQAAVNQLGASIQDYPDNATIGQTSTKLQGFKDQVARAQAAEKKLASGLKCP